MCALDMNGDDARQPLLLIAASARSEHSAIRSSIESESFKHQVHV